MLLAPASLFSILSVLHSALVKAQSIKDLIADIEEAEMRRLVRTHRCGESGCEGGLAIAWRGAPPPAWGKGEWIVRCANNIEHARIQRETRTRQLYDSERGWIEVDIMTQKEIGIPGALAVPQTREAMLERANQTLQAGLWPQTMTPQQKALMVQVALAYGLDPLMGELVLYQGKPLVTINARRRKDTEAGHHPSIRFRFLTAEEKQGYIDAGAINEGDLVQVGILTTEWGNSVEGIGKVTKAERTAPSARSRDPRGLAHPIVADNPIEMCQKRAETRARLMAYGPIPLPQRPMEGITIEGEVVQEPNLNDLRRDIDELFPNDDPFPEDAPPPAEEAFDPETAPPPPLPATIHTRGHFEQVLKDEGWTLARLELQVLHMALDRYIREGHKLQDAYMAWREHVSIPSERAGT